MIIKKCSDALRVNFRKTPKLKTENIGVLNSFEGVIRKEFCSLGSQLLSLKERVVLEVTLEKDPDFS